MNWHPFTLIWTAVGDPLNNIVTAVYTGLIGWVHPGYKGAAVVYLALISVMLVSGKIGDIGRDWLPQVIRVVLVSSVLSAAVYGPLIRDEFLNTIPTGLINVITTATGTPMTTNSVPATFDRTWIDGVAAGIRVADQQSGLSGIPRSIFVWIVYIPLATFAVLVTFLIWFVSQFFLSLIVAVGPIFIAFAPFGPTRRWFEMWISSLVGTVFLQGLVVLALGIVLAIETTLVKSVLATGLGTPGAATSSILMLVLAAAIYALFAVLLYFVPGLASSLIGGTHGQIAAMGRQYFGQPVSAAAAGIGRSAASTLSTGAKSGWSAARAAISPPSRPMGRASGHPTGRPL